MSDRPRRGFIRTGIVAAASAVSITAASRYLATGPAAISEPLVDSLTRVIEVIRAESCQFRDGPVPLAGRSRPGP
jgi:hypothetical protein